MEKKKTLGSWAIEQNIRLLDTKYYDDKNLYTIKEYEKIVPRNIEVPLFNENNNDNELITVINDIAVLNTDISDKIAEFERQVKTIKEQEDKLKEKILNEMEAKGLLSIETNNLLISYVQPTDREIFDSKRFRIEHDDLYDEYVKMTPVKSSIRIKVK